MSFSSANSLSPPLKIKTAPLSLSRSRGRINPTVASTGNGAPASRAAKLVEGRVQEGPDLSVEVNGLRLPNPFVIASGPPGTNYVVMKKAFDEGWGGVICKTLSLDSSKVVNVTPRYAKLRAPHSRDVIGWQNIELISDRPFEVMLAELKQLKAEYPHRVLIASIMEEFNRDAWEEIIGRCEEVGVDAFEINFSCPHGMPERRMGMAMGQDCELLHEVCTGVMLHGYGLVKSLCGGLQGFMEQHGFTSISDFKGHSLQYFTTHTDLVRRQREAVEHRNAAKRGLASDKEWTGDGFVQETETMVSN
ncbi:unnamed protein product [Closterium sp. NIES-54]